MRRLLTALAVLMTGIAQAGQPLSESDMNIARELQGLALADDLAWSLVASLTTEVGPRPGGSQGDVRAVAWADAKFRELGFDRVWSEPVRFPLWRRGVETAAVVSPWPQPLVVTALGGSPGTEGAVEAELVSFETVDDLQQVEPSVVQGRIVLLTRRQERSRDGAGYSATVPNRSRGTFAAAEKGAVAVLVRSAGTNPERLAHTGNLSGSDERERVPAAAVSHADADLLERMLEHGGPVRVSLTLDCGYDGEAESFNVIGEFDGSDEESGFVVIGGHLDSWDLGTGAIDDGAGVAITMAAAKHVADLDVRPRRGIRVVLFANEEQGIYGGKAYAASHGEELDTHVIGAESDFGAGLVWRFRSEVSAEAGPWVAQLAELLAPLGIEHDGEGKAHGGADLGQMKKAGMPVIDLNQDASRYFDWHHTASDTLDKIDPEELRQNVAAWVTFVWAAAQARVNFGPIETEDKG